MAKKKTIKNVIAEQIKALIDAGDFQGAQTLISGEVQNRAPTPTKKKGRPPKVFLPAQPIAPPAPISPSANNDKNSSCVAPSRRVDQPPESRKIEKDGKSYTMSLKIPWKAPKKITFKEDNSVAKTPGLKYPERVAPRDPAEQIEYICHQCAAKVMLYPGQGPESDMLYTCPHCISRGKRR